MFRPPVRRREPRPLSHPMAFVTRFPRRSSMFLRLSLRDWQRCPRLLLKPVRPPRGGSCFLYKSSLLVQPSARHGVTDSHQGIPFRGLLGRHLFGGSRSFRLRYFADGLQLCPQREENYDQ